jgi:hypothetical protein
MQFETEAALQVYCLSILKARKIEAKEEVSVGPLRADIVTEDAVYELKKVLTRESLYQALGQAIAYNKVLNKKYICIVGQAPTNVLEYDQVIKVARAISSAEIVVSFVETDPFWVETKVGQEDPFQTVKLWLIDLIWMSAIGVAIVLMAAMIANSTITLIPVKVSPKNQCQPIETQS